MSEQQLKDFGAHAETLVELPDFTGLDRRGHALRLRRRVSVAATLAAVLAVVGVTVTQVHRDDRVTRPIKPPAGVGAQTYVGGTMKTLAAGTYRLHPSSSDPTAELTVPDGWNSWVGPNKFDGHAPGRSNNEALGHLTWYVGALVLEVDGVNTHGCSGIDIEGISSARALVAALPRTFGFEVIKAAQPVHRFGYPATRMRVRVTKAIAHCGENATVFGTTSDGGILYPGVGWIADIWVVEVHGTPIYVQKIWSPTAPRIARSELDSVVDSIRFRSAE